jgi:hypothetical protein
MSSNSGYRSELFETVTASDYLRAPAFGFMRFAFTQGSTFEAVVYACETKTFAAGTCTALATLDTTTADLPLKTGRPYIVIDVTTAETAGFVSYISFRGHIISAGGGESGGGVQGVGPLSEMLAFTASDGDLWIRDDAPDLNIDCSSAVVGVEANDVLCMYNDGGWAEAGLAGGTDNLGNHTASQDLVMGANDITLSDTQTVDGRDVSVDGDYLDAFDDYFCDIYAGADIGAKCNAAYADAVSAGSRGVNLWVGRASYSQTTKMDFCDESGVVASTPVRLIGHGNGRGSRGGTVITAASGLETTATTASMVAAAGTGPGGRDKITCATCTFFTDGFRRGDLLEISGFVNAENNFGKAVDKLPAKIYSVSETELVLEGEELDAGLVAETVSASVRQLQAQVEMCRENQWVEDIAFFGGGANEYADIAVHFRPDNAPNEACTASTTPYAQCTGLGTGSLVAIIMLDSGVDSIRAEDHGTLGVAITSPNSQGQGDHFSVRNSFFAEIPIEVWADNAQSQPGVEVSHNSFTDWEWTGFWCSSGNCRANFNTIISDAAACVALDHGVCNAVYGAPETKSLSFVENNMDIWGGDGVVMAAETTLKSTLILRDNVIHSSYDSGTAYQLVDATDFCGIVVNEGNLYTNNAGPLTGNPAPQIVVGNSNHPTCPTTVVGKSEYRDRLAAGPDPVLVLNDSIYFVPGTDDLLVDLGTPNNGGIVDWTQIVNMPAGFADETDDGGGAPADADYLVGTANGSLSAEIVVGTSPGGDLGGTWASPTVDDNSHSHLIGNVTPFTTVALLGQISDETALSTVYMNGLGGWTTPSGSSLWEQAAGLTELTDDDDDVAWGYDGDGTAMTDYAFYFDESEGDLLINVEGASIDLQAHATQGGTVAAKEGADTGGNFKAGFKVPDTMDLTADRICELEDSATPFDGCVSPAALGTDAVGTAELDDDANSPTAGYAVIVETGAASFDYLDLSVTYQGLNTHLTDLSDGTLTGSKVGSGIAAANITGALNLGASSIRGAVAIETTGATPWTLTSAEGQWIFADEAGAAQIDLPALASGSSFCVYSTTAQVISLNPNGTETIIDASITPALDAGDELDSPGAIGDYVCLLSNGTSWYVLGKSGTWVDGGAS